VPMIRADRNGGGKMSFIFDPSVSNVNELKTAWANQQGKVPALPYANAIKNLKSLCHMG
jgi:hypothetical protein